MVYQHQRDRSKRKELMRATVLRVRRPLVLFRTVPNT